MSLQIRCSGEQPVCNRCARLQRKCIYTSTTSTTRSLRFISNSEKAARRIATSSKGVHRGNSVIHNDAGWPVSEDYPSTDSPTILSKHKDIPYFGILESLLYTLVDVYFENAYNASLLLNKGQFLKSLEAGTVEAHLILSVCAYAAKYLATVPLHEMSRFADHLTPVFTVTKTAKHLSATMVS